MATWTELWTWKALLLWAWAAKTCGQTLLIRPWGPQEQTTTPLWVPILLIKLNNLLLAELLSQHMIFLSDNWNVISQFAFSHTLISHYSSVHRFWEEWHHCAFMVSLFVFLLIIRGVCCTRACTAAVLWWQWVKQGSWVTVWGATAFPLPEHLVNLFTIIFLCRENIQYFTEQGWMI